MSTILETYQELVDANFFEEFATEILKKLQELFPDTLISYRIKSYESLAGKLERKGNKYNSVGEITDIIAFRVVSYRAEDILPIQRMLEHSFEKDDINSIDKRTHVGAEFGYASLHLILSINEFKSNSLKIRKNFSTFLNQKFEVQVRTILEHAWAESEHDLGYKPELIAGLPLQLRRSFARISALLETADNEFTRLRQDLNSHQIRVEANKDDTDYSALPIGQDDQRGLMKFFLTSKLVKRIEEDIKNATGLTSSNRPGDIYATDANFMVEYGITSIEQLKTLILKHENDIIKTAIKVAGTSYAKIESKGMSVSLPRDFLLQYVRKFIVDTMKPISAAEDLDSSTTEAK